MQYYRSCEQKTKEDEKTPNFKFEDNFAIEPFRSRPKPTSSTVGEGSSSGINFWTNVPCSENREMTFTQ